MGEVVKMKRPIVCGGRDYMDRDHIWSTLVELDHKHGPFECVIHGAARGVDNEAMIWAQTCERQHLPMKPDYVKYASTPKLAPLMRNQRMIDEGRPDGCIAFPGKNGTADMVKRAKAAGLTVIEVQGRKAREAQSPQETR